MYRNSAMNVQHQRTHLGLMLGLEAALRSVKARPQSTNPRAGKSVFQGSLGGVIQHAMQEGGYCIDAPNNMPAGCCYSLEYEDGKFIPCQAETERG